MIKSKEQEKEELRLEFEGKLKKASSEAEAVTKQHKAQLEGLNKEMAEVGQRLGKREEVITRLEKEKREVAVAKDKALKQVTNCVITPLNT